MAGISTKTSKDGVWMELVGYSAILKSLKLNKDQRENLQIFLEKEARKVIRTAKELVHKKTWRLHDSIRMLTGGSGGAGSQVRADVVAGGKSIRGRFVGYAQAHHDINPYLDNAVSAHSAGYSDRLKKAIKWKWV